jgi:hypothetical protein
VLRIPLVGSSCIVWESIGMGRSMFSISRNAFLLFWQTSVCRVISPLTLDYLGMFGAGIFPSRWELWHGSWATFPPDQFNLFWLVRVCHWHLAARDQAGPLKIDRPYCPLFYSDDPLWHPLDTLGE